MKRPFTHQAKRARIALAAVAAFSALGIGAAQAQSFVTADLTVNSVGFLDCAFKETGLIPGVTINYTCAATDVGWVTQCFIRNKPLSNIAPKLHVAHAADGLVTTQGRNATNRRTVTSAILTAYPTVEEQPGTEPLCPEVEGQTITEEITAIRWCNASLVDTTNNIPGATVPELFRSLTQRGAGNVPPCTTLAILPTDI
jgi:hypothetical protein